MVFFNFQLRFISLNYISGFWLSKLKIIMSCYGWKCIKRLTDTEIYCRHETGNNTKIGTVKKFIPALK